MAERSFEGERQLRDEPYTGINLAARQQCIDSALEVCRIVLQHGGSSFIDALGQFFGHCFCKQETWAGVTHRICCKCFDRIKVKVEA